MIFFFFGGGDFKQQERNRYHFICLRQCRGSMQRECSGPLSFSQHVANVDFSNISYQPRFSESRGRAARPVNSAHFRATPPLSVFQVPLRGLPLPSASAGKARPPRLRRVSGVPRSWSWRTGRQSQQELRRTPIAKAGPRARP